MSFGVFILTTKFEVVLLIEGSNWDGEVFNFLLGVICSWETVRDRALFTINHE